jgi:muconolactone D-isomerase
MEFMVFITNKFPADGDKEFLRNLTKQESEQAAVLSAQGFIKKLWRRTGQRSNVGIWCAPDATSLHTALASLPFFPWLEIEVWPLSEHPNDPKKYGESS